MLGYGIATLFLVLNLCDVWELAVRLWSRCYGVYGVQASIGGSSEAGQYVADSMPASSGMNTRDFLRFFLFGFLLLPVTGFSVHKPESHCTYSAS